MIEIDLNAIYQFFAQFEGQSTLTILNILLFKYWGWLIFVFIFFRYLAWPEYLLSKNMKWASKMPPAVILAIDVPRRNEQSIQAMENLFDHLQGTHGTFTKWAKYVEGEFQRSFSVELVSIDGNVQFLIRCPGDWRNLVEAAVYGQYPDAEITEVEDYVNSVPKDYPNDTHDIWGVEFTLSNKNIYLPIKPWFKFEHAFAKTFCDPIAALLENMSSIGEGEQIWIQIILTPLAVDWGKDGQKEINKLIGESSPVTKPGIISQALKGPVDLVSEVTEQLAGFNLSGEPSTEEKKFEKSSNRIMLLSPAEREQLEAMERKSGKWAFKTKIRYLYINEKGKGNKSVGVNGIIGAIKQWNDPVLNGLRPDLKATGTNSPQYVFINYRRKVRKNTIMRAYRGRNTVIGTPGKPMTTEELASLWHFPSMYVKAPLLKTTAFTKAAAPVSLPVKEKRATDAAEEVEVPIAEHFLGEKEDVVEEATRIEPSFDYDSDDFEMQFAKDKESFKASRPARDKKIKKIAKQEKQKVEEIKKTEAKAAKEVQKDKNGTPSNLPFID